MEPRAGPSVSTCSGVPMVSSSAEFTPAPSAQNEENAGFSPKMWPPRGDANPTEAVRSWDPMGQHPPRAAAGFQQSESTWIRCWGAWPSSSPPQICSWGPHYSRRMLLQDGASSRSPNAASSPKPSPFPPVQSFRKPGATGTEKERDQGVPSPALPPAGDCPPPSWLRASHSFGTGRYKIGCCSRRGW